MQKVSYRRFERLTADNRLQPCVLISGDDDAQANVAFDFNTDSDIQTALDVLAELNARRASHGHKGFEFGGNNDECEISFDALGDFPARVFHFSDRNAFDSAFAAAIKFSEFSTTYVPRCNSTAADDGLPADYIRKRPPIEWTTHSDGTKIFFETLGNYGEGSWFLPTLVLQDGEAISFDSEKCGIAIRKFGKKPANPTRFDRGEGFIFAVTAGRWPRASFCTLGVYNDSFTAEDIATELIKTGRSNANVYVMPPTDISVCKAIDTIINADDDEQKK